MYQATEKDLKGISEEIKLQLKDKSNVRVLTEAEKKGEKRTRRWFVFGFLATLPVFALIWGMIIYFFIRGDGDPFAPLIMQVILHGGIVLGILFLSAFDDNNLTKKRQAYVIKGYVALKVSRLRVKMKIIYYDFNSEEYAVKVCAGEPFDKNKYLVQKGMVVDLLAMESKITGRLDALRLKPDTIN